LRHGGFFVLQNAVTKSLLAFGHHSLVLCFKALSLLYIAQTQTKLKEVSFLSKARSVDCCGATKVVGEFQEMRKFCETVNKVVVF
jgi:hypothetical protein